MTQAAAVWWGSTLMTKKTMQVNSDCSNNAASVTGDIELVMSRMMSPSPCEAGTHKTSCVVTIFKLNS